MSNYKPFAVYRFKRIESLKTRYSLEGVEGEPISDTTPKFPAVYEKGEKKGKRYVELSKNSVKDAFCIKCVFPRCSTGEHEGLEKLVMSENNALVAYGDAENLRKNGTPLKDGVIASISPDEQFLTVAFFKDAKHEIKTIADLFVRGEVVLSA